MAKDFLGNELCVGDEVVYMRLNYRDFTRGKIIKINDKKCTILPLNSTHKNMQFFNQVIKINR